MVTASKPHKCLGKQVKNPIMAPHLDKRPEKPQDYWPHNEIDTGDSITLALPLTLHTNRKDRGATDIKNIVVLEIIRIVYIN